MSYISVLQQLADSGLASPHSWVCSSAHRSLAPSDLSYLCYSNRTRIAHNVFQEIVSSGEHVCIASQSSQSPKPCQITKCMFNMELKTDRALSASAGSRGRPNAFVIDELGLNTECYGRPDGASVYGTMLEFFYKDHYPLVLGFSLSVCASASQKVVPCSYDAKNSQRAKLVPTPTFDHIWRTSPLINELLTLGLWCCTLLLFDSVSWKPPAVTVTKLISML